MTYKRRKLVEQQKAEKVAVSVMEKLVKTYPQIHADMFAMNMKVAGATDEMIAMTSAKTFSMARLKKWIVRSPNYVLSNRIKKRRAPMVVWDSLVFQSAPL